MITNSNAFATISSLFEEQVKKHPKNAAIYLDNEVISYDTLNKKANQYARYLQHKGVQLNDIVAIQLTRSFEFFLAIFAVLKAGGAYLPLDPFAPEARNQTIITDGQIKFIIVDGPELLTKHSRNNLQVVNIHEEVNHELSHNLNTLINPNNLAYVMYTSGTTGTPKGVMISHEALVNRILWMQKVFPIQAQDVLFQKTHTCFDISVWESWWWSITGASVVFLPPKKEHDIKLFIQMIEQYQISAIHFVPSVLRIFLDYIKQDFLITRLKTLKYLFAGGEVLDARSVNLFNKLFKDQKTQIANLYGPTEATIDVSYFICEKQKRYRKIPIGKPIQNIQLFVLDEQLKKTGSKPGELFISGVGLAKGYLNNSELTQNAFLNNPYLSEKKMYRTGDIVYWNKNNELIFLGRKDDQVKVHGIRIELEEIQYHLLEHPAIQEAVIICEKINYLDPQLIVFLVANTSFLKLSPAEIKAFLKTRLPIYMIPEQYIYITTLPLKENGKVDKIKLSQLRV